MRIVEVATNGTVGTDRMGPVSTVICELSNRFAERGHDVTVAGASGDGPRPFLDPRIRFLELDAPPTNQLPGVSRSRVRRIFGRWQSHYRFMKELTSRLDLSQADIVHFHAPISAFLARRLFGIDSVCYTAHTPTWSLAPELRKGPIGRLMRWIETDVIRKSRVSIGLGSYLADSVRDGDVVTIPNGLDVDAWLPLERGEARKALGIDNDALVLLFVGRIAPVKGIDVLLEAVARVASSLPDLNVFVIGPLSGTFDSRDEHVEPYAAAMLELAKGLPVEFVGFVSNRELRFRQYLAASDALLLPSRSEPQGLVVLEALAMGTPVIGSRTGGIPEMISRDSGYLFPPGDAEALADCIRHAHEDRDRLQALRPALRARVERDYSWRATADRYLAVFEQRLAAQKA